jgi:hypothetical protein
MVETNAHEKQERTGVIVMECKTKGRERGSEEGLLCLNRLNLKYSTREGQSGFI